jgi:hypothetical protein
LDIKNVTSGVNDWVIKLFISAIESVSKEEDRLAILRWLAMAKEIVEDGTLSKPEIAKRLYDIISSKELFKIAFNGVGEGLKNYKKSDLPLPVKIAIPVALGAMALVGGQGAGVAALGGAVGMPIILVVFVGTAGISSILESFFGSGSSRSLVVLVGAMIARDEILRRARKEMRDAMIAETAEPQRQPVPEEEDSLREALMTMDPFLFEQHVMQFFQDQGVFSWVTKRSNDLGVDGFARHQSGLIVVQCKRNSPDSPVGRPLIQQFKGVVEENQAWRGYIVTTSRFTEEAIESAKLNEKLVLIDLNGLVNWHRDGVKI